MNRLSFAHLREANLARCLGGFGHQLDDWTLADWAVAVGGEIGEALNVVKKLNRERDGIAGNERSEQQLLDDLADELADVVVYLDLTVARARGERLGVLWDREDFGGIRAITTSETPDASILSASEWAAGLMEAGAALASCALNQSDDAGSACDEILKAVDGVARYYGINLDEAVVRKFNRTSRKVGWEIVLEAAR